MNEYLLKLAGEFEEEADTAYSYEKWHESATLYRLAVDLRSKAAEAQESEAEEAPVRVVGAQGEVYDVTPDSCTCLDFRYRGAPCKHIQNLKVGNYSPNGSLRYHVYESGY